ncbi:hypothetical protein [Microviridae sp.]|nr:hypothetical protein [Microviridae sp.]UOF78488.1 hypothetical protein [Microviridae sp.]
MKMRPPVNLTIFTSNKKADLPPAFSPHRRPQTMHERLKIPIIQRPRNALLVIRQRQKTIHLV